jgi:hypothetical protein
MCGLLFSLLSYFHIHTKIVRRLNGAFILLILVQEKKNCPFLLEDWFVFDPTPSMCCDFGGILVCFRPNTTSISSLVILEDWSVFAFDAPSISSTLL